MKEISFKELHDIVFAQSQNSSAKISFIYPESFINLLQYHLGKSLNWHQLKNVNFHVSQIGFYLSPYHFFLNILDKETQWLTSTGIMNHLVNLVYKDKRSFVSVKEWKVLTMENLQFGFVIWLCSCAVTVVAFVAEVMFWIVFSKVRACLIGYIRHEWNKIPVNYPFKVTATKKLSVSNDETSRHARSSRNELLRPSTFRFGRFQ